MGRVLIHQDQPAVGLEKDIEASDDPDEPKWNLEQ
jgi:hypothetical protein